MTLKIVRRPAGAECASILAELPEWFGIPQSNADYAAAAEREQAWVAEAAGQALGLMVLMDPGFAAIDVHLLAVRPHVHRQGVGRALIGQALAVTRGLGKPFLTVKTQGPSSGYAPYGRTRLFYEAVGFSGLEEITPSPWGPENPCLIMVMPVTDRSPSARSS